MNNDTQDKALRPRTEICHYTVDSFANGIAFGQHRIPEEADPRDFFALRLQNDSEQIRLRSRYALDKKNPLHELEKRLKDLSQRGILRRSHIYLGVTNDPFLPFNGKFDASMRFLDIFQRYTPGLLTVQTRSPLVVIAMPVLKRLGRHASVTIGIETPLEEARKRYTPELPKVTERLKAAAALRRFGVEVTFQVSPILPYGDWRKDAAAFAELLDQNADYVHVQSITDGTDSKERRIRSSCLVQKLAQDRKYHWLRPDTGTPLCVALGEIAPQKLLTPERQHLKSKQLEMFAA